jgi:hypothetical protein
MTASPCKFFLAPATRPMIWDCRSRSRKRRGASALQEIKPLGEALPEALSLARPGGDSHGCLAFETLFRHARQRVHIHDGPLPATHCGILTRSFSNKLSLADS